MGIRVWGVIPVKTVSEMNVRQHWGTVARRARKQKLAAYNAVRNEFISRSFGLAPPGMCVGTAAPCFGVLMVRHGRDALDDDNLASAVKHVRDGIADALMVDDGNTERIRFHCDGEVGRGQFVEFYIDIMVQDEFRRKEDARRADSVGEGLGASAPGDEAPEERHPDRVVQGRDGEGRREA